MSSGDGWVDCNSTCQRYMLVCAGMPIFIICSNRTIGSKRSLAEAKRWCEKHVATSNVPPRYVTKEEKI
jgi:hypothetical protein